MNRMSIVAAQSTYVQRATDLAAAMHLAFCTDSAAIPAGEWYLLVDQAGLSLAQAGKSAASGVQSAFHQGLPTARATSGDLLLKALGFPKSKVFTIVDATAGLGADAAVMAMRAERLLLVERSAVLAALLREGLQYQARLGPRVSLHEGDAITLLTELSQTESLDIIYLDPMFHLPQSLTTRKKKAALPKKSAQSLQAIVGADVDQGLLLATALQLARQRVVVKRPRTAEAIAGPAPDFTVSGKQLRYDVYLAKN